MDRAGQHGPRLASTSSSIARGDSFPRLSTLGATSCVRDGPVSVCQRGRPHQEAAPSTSSSTRSSTPPSTRSPQRACCRVACGPSRALLFRRTQTCDEGDQAMKRMAFTVPETAEAAGHLTNHRLRVRAPGRHPVAHPRPPNRDHPRRRRTTPRHPPGRPRTRHALSPTPTSTKSAPIGARNA